MYVTHTYKCEKCGLTEDRFIKKEHADKQFHFDCPEGLAAGFGVAMKRLPPATPTTFKHADPSSFKK